MKRSWCPGPATRVPLRTLLSQCPPRTRPESLPSGAVRRTRRYRCYQCPSSVFKPSRGRLQAEGGVAPRRGQTPSERPRNTAATLLTSMTAVPSVLGRGRAAGRDTGSGRARLDTGFLELVSLRSCRACLIICDAYSPYFN